MISFVGALHRGSATTFCQRGVAEAGLSEPWAASGARLDPSPGEGLPLAPRFLCSLAFL